MDNLNSFGIINGSCDNFSPEQFNNKFSSHGKKLFIMNFNIRSFNANFDQFSVFLNELTRLPDVIILTETWNSDYKNAEIFGFKSFHCNRSSDRRGGGVSIFVNSQFKAISTTISMGSKPEIEYIHVKLTFNNTSCKPLDLIAIYHPPNSTLLQSFFDHLDVIMDSLETNIDG